MTSNIKVSVIIAAYEAADFIAAAITACLAQTETSIEVIIVDDASAQSLEPAVSAAANGDPRVRFLRQDQNSGPSGARNRALEEARGTYVAILDADDSMHPDRLETLLRAAEAHGADIIVDNMIADRIDAAANGADEPFLTPQAIPGDHEIDLETYMDPRTSAVFGQPLGYLKPLIRRQFLLDTGLDYDTSLTNSEDYYLIAELLARRAKMILIPYMGYRYTIQAGSISHRLNPRQTAAIIAAEQAFQNRHRSSFSATARGAANRRLTQIKRDHQFETLIEDLRRRSIFGFTNHLFANLTNAPGHILKLMAIAMTKLGRIGR